MKVCKNCTAKNEDNASKCASCSMVGMFVHVPDEHVIRKVALKPIYSACRNCGTADTGHDSVCSQCRFPLPAATQSSSTKIQAS